MRPERGVGFRSFRKRSRDPLAGLEPLELDQERRCRLVEPMLEANALRSPGLHSA
jgi:hypothetical protein